MILCFDSQTTAGIYLLKVNNRNTRTKCEISSKLTISVFISHLVLVLALLTLNSEIPDRILLL